MRSEAVAPVWIAMCSALVRPDVERLRSAVSVEARTAVRARVAEGRVVPAQALERRRKMVVVDARWIRRRGLH